MPLPADPRRERARANIIGIRSGTKLKSAISTLNAGTTTSNEWIPLHHSVITFSFIKIRIKVFHQFSLEIIFKLNYGIRSMMIRVLGACVHKWLAGIFS